MIKLKLEFFLKSMLLLKTMQTCVAILSLTAVLAVAFAPQSALAVPHRCGDRIKTTPCDMPSHTIKRNVYTPVLGDSMSYKLFSPDFTRLQPMTPKLSNQSFKAVDNSQGFWRGYVAGNGIVRLALYILRAGAIETVREIGKLQLQAGDAPTRFSFKSTLPKGSDWTWQIVAR